MDRDDVYLSGTLQWRVRAPPPPATHRGTAVVDAVLKLDRTECARGRQSRDPVVRFGEVRLMPAADFASLPEAERLTVSGTVRASDKPGGAGPYELWVRRSE